MASLTVGPAMKWKTD